MLLFVLGCSRGPDDPRPGILASLPEGRPVRLEPAAALREDRFFEACAGFKQVVSADGDEGAWSGLLTVAARDPNCLPEASGSALAVWAKGRDGWADAVGEWDAGHGLWVDPDSLSPPSRLRVLLRGDDQAAAAAAAVAVLQLDATDPFACVVVATDRMQRGELEAAIGTCPSGTGAALARVRAAALDEAGRPAAAAAAYDAAGLGLHAAAVLYQTDAAHDPEALQRMDEDVPPVRIHRGWLSVLRGEAPDGTGLDDAPESTMIRALAGDPAAVAQLADDPSLEALVLRARLTGDLASLQTELASQPQSDVLLRASLGIRLDRGLDPGPALAALAAVDPVHVYLGGVVMRREAPWSAIAPWTWSELGRRAHLPDSGVHDAVGDAWRAAAALPEASRNVALTALQADHPELRGLARLRAGGSILDVPPGVR